MSIPTISLKKLQAYQVKGPHFKVGIWTGLYFVGVDVDGDVMRGIPTDKGGDIDVQRMLV